MKTIIKNYGFIIIIISIFISSVAFTQEVNKETTVEIKTSAQCEMCKDRIEEALAFEKGIIKAELNMETKIVEVTFKTNKTDSGKIKEAITKVGYDADEVNADKKAYDKLPACCKKPDDPDHEKH